MLRSFWSLAILICLTATLAALPDAGAGGRKAGLAKLKKGELAVISGLDGRFLRRFKGAQKGDEFGSDVGFDALPRVGFQTVAWAVGAPGGAGGSGRFFALDAETGRRIWWVDGDSLAGGAVERFGEAIVDLGHINGDTPVHWAVGAPGRGVAGGAPAAVVIVHAPNGDLVERLRLEGSDTSMLGWKIAQSDDVPTGDSVIDHFVATAPGEANGSKQSAGAVHRFDSFDGSRQWTVLGKKKGQQLGYSMSFVDDVSGDGLIDHAVGAPGSDKVDGAVFLIASSSGRVVRQIKAPAKAGLFGFAITRLDVDRDGVSDLVVGAPATQGAAGERSGAVYAFSGVDRSLLMMLEGESPGQWFGASLEVTGDLDGDGFNELIVGSLVRNEEKPKKDLIGGLDVISPTTGAALLKIRGKRAGERLGWRIISGRLDWNADGSADLLVAVSKAGEPILPE